MPKWFDENGTDIDAYPNEAFKGGVYDRKPEKIVENKGPLSYSIECLNLGQHDKCPKCQCSCHLEKK